MKNKHNKSENHQNSVKVSIIFKSVLGIIVLLAVFAAVVSVIGFNGLTDALLSQYAEGAFRTANTAAVEMDGDKIDDFAQSGGNTKEYLTTWKGLDKLCNASGVTFIYVIRPDLTDYAHITFLFSTANENCHYTRYDFGYVRETTNDEYREKYRNLYEGKTTQELVIRDKGYIETDPHITSMVPLKDSDGNTTAILCVQRQMENLVNERNSYMNKVFLATIILMVTVSFVQIIYLYRVFLRPVKRITDEASRFSQESHPSENKLTDSIKSRDEIGALASSIDRMEVRIMQYLDDLTKATAEKERINTELSLASRIQSNMLPNTFPAFPERSEFDIFAAMDPAKEVGGDFYDFFPVDDDHLCVVIADVSGKGVPAALFMMSAKIILANYAKMGKTPAEILSDANTAICACNQEEMFVTVWLGILEISTGRLTAANAGHESPVLKQPDGRFALLPEKHGFVLGGMDGMVYRDYSIELQRGAKLFLYTDGVPEATNGSEELFGLERMVEALNKAADAPVQEILRTVRREVDGFVEEAEQFDDLTMLCLEYRGKKEKADNRQEMERT